MKVKKRCKHLFKPKENVGILCDFNIFRSILKQPNSQQTINLPGSAKQHSYEIAEIETKG